MEKFNKYEEGDLVFAKMKYEPPWPSVILNAVSRGKYNVMFYGSRKTRVLPTEAMIPFTETSRHLFNIEKNLKKKHYRAGMAEIDAVVAVKGAPKGSPDDNCENFLAPPKKKPKFSSKSDLKSSLKIPIKTIHKGEHDNPVEKQEPDDEEPLSIMIKLTEKLKNVLGLVQADADSAIKYLEAMQNEVLPLVSNEDLLKYPEFVKAIKRLCFYYGNVKSWNLNHRDATQFLLKAKIIRLLSSAIYNELQGKFIHLADPTKTFWNVFDDEVQKDLM